MRLLTLPYFSKQLEHVLLALQFTTSEKFVCIKALTGDQFTQKVALLAPALLRMSGPGLEVQVGLQDVATCSEQLELLWHFVTESKDTFLGDEARMGGFGHCSIRDAARAKTLRMLGPAPKRAKEGSGVPGPVTSFHDIGSDSLVSPLMEQELISKRK